MKAPLIVAAMSLLLVSGQQISEAAKKELQALSGRWTVTSGEAEGEKANVDPGELVVEFKDRQLRLLDAASGEVQESGTIVGIDPTCSPKTIDLMVIVEDKKSQRVEGIYEIDGERLRLALAFRSGVKERPLAFVTKRGAEIIVLSCRRATQK